MQLPLSGSIRQPQFPVKVAYTLATIIVYILVVAIAWFVIGQYMGAVQAAGREVAQQIGSIDTNYVNADQFMTAIFSFFLAIGIFALAIWVYNYQQTKNLMYGG